MSPIATELLGVIADDFTGALDAGAEFVRAGFETTLLLEPECAEPAQVRVISTDSRDGAAAPARRRAAEAAGLLASRRIFKKIDSTMRGHIAAEIVAVLDATGIDKAVVCPAAIEAGRTVQNGRLYVNGAPLHASAFARDPRWPASTSELIQLAGGTATHLPLATVRAGSGALALAIATAPTRIVTVDACTLADLDAISQAIVASNSLPCGALGLARAWARQFSRTPPGAMATPIHGQSGPVLVVAGSRHPSTIAQVERLIAERPVVPVEVTPEKNERRLQASIASALAALAAGSSVVVRAPGRQFGARATQRALLGVLGECAERICRAAALSGLVLTGGETASAICRQLGAAGVRILGELEVGIPWGRIIDGAAAGLPLVTKAGGFGHAEALIRAHDLLRQQSAAL